MIKTIVFTDIHNSSKLWKTNPKEMYKKLIKHNNIIFKIAKENKGFIVKNLGDSYMLSFNKLLLAINFAISLQKEFPLIISEKEKLELKIGIAQGEVNEKEYVLQGCNLKDYFGHTVNVASRLESKVAKKNQIAISVLNSKDKKYIDMLKKISETNKYKLKNIKYKELCNKSKNINYECRLLSVLHGIGELNAYVLY